MSPRSPSELDDVTIATVVLAGWQIVEVHRNICILFTPQGQRVNLYATRAEAAREAWWMMHDENFNEVMGAR